MARPTTGVSYVRATLKGMALTFKHMRAAKVRGTWISRGEEHRRVADCHTVARTHRMIRTSRGDRSALAAALSRSVPPTAITLVPASDEYATAIAVSTRSTVPRHLLRILQEVCPEEAIHVGVHYRMRILRDRFVYDLERLSAQTHQVSTLWILRSAGSVDGHCDVRVRGLRGGPSARHAVITRRSPTRRRSGSCRRCSRSRASSSCSTPGSSGDPGAGVRRRGDGPVSLRDHDASKTATCGDAEEAPRVDRRPGMRGRACVRRTGDAAQLFTAAPRETSSRASGRRRPALVFAAAVRRGRHHARWCRGCSRSALFPAYLVPFEITSFSLLAAVIGASSSRRRSSDAPRTSLALSAVLFAIGAAGVPHRGTRSCCSVPS